MDPAIIHHAGGRKHIDTRGTKRILLVWTLPGIAQFVYDISTLFHFQHQLTMAASPRRLPQASLGRSDGYST